VTFLVCSHYTLDVMKERRVIDNKKTRRASWDDYIIEECEDTRIIFHRFCEVMICDGRSIRLIDMFGSVESLPMA
jgi:hypothetical protein